MLILFTGTIGQSGLGGQAWANLQYVLGLRQLGHEVYYLEDAGECLWTYDWEAGQLTDDLRCPARYIDGALAPFGLQHHWIYRTRDDSIGLSVPKLVDLCANADLLLIRAAPLYLHRTEYDLPKRRAFIDVDPGFTQIRLVNGDPGLERALARCESLFTVAQRIGSSDCDVPTAGRQWIPTLPPVCLSEWPWPSAEEATHFTVVMRWQGMNEVNYSGRSFGMKDREFPKFAGLPRLSGHPFRLIVLGHAAALEEYGWDLVDGYAATATVDAFRLIVQSARAEFGIAKHAYVALRTGWFSDRSVCFLASGRPVLLQDTGIGATVPTGAGIVTFTDLQTAVTGVKAINESYDAHRRAARQLAEEVFASERVLLPLLEAATV